MTSTQPIRGILLCAAALLLFAALDTTTKVLTAHFEAPVIVAARFIGNLLLMLVVMAPRGGREMVRTTRTALVWLRGCCLACASVLMALALTRMPVGEATAIMFLAPTLVALGGGLLLGEEVGLRGWGAVLLGLTGVVLIARPGGGLDVVGVMLALGAAILNGTYQLMSRTLAATEKTFALLFYSAAVGSLVFGAVAPFYWAGRMPTLLEGALLASLGLWGGVGHYLFTAAFRHAPASTLAPITYLQVLWATVLGWIVFRHVPDPVAIVGMLTIGSAGMLIVLKRRRRTPPATV
ncbi:drug/metabolite transporter (DMT)-like permease [Sphingobium sp. B2D3A]|uniref:DMT family transporter n=1 Tax=unclassified Sphingobium TaxID=2611147 RepID=UPI00222579F1|nr:MULTISPECIES: DMT family transporter [unclassified Sphingobium]MCW2338826.1 drug/metabolite transporter (DMT)-like permease [Sphingobium sp. B2D3A]MCW2382451.1 drug/metabolite transporter (DMT)-like permease [Sphingobium sp. B2D3B]MCW2385253.1 drug/metabolite transporter (DMT)-like permease [Sphingobium sp. B2D3D]MCW2397376.1 drug/metabolite transporter (DMT)-like permease [Sphingobium sp. B2D3C]